MGNKMWDQWIIWQIEAACPTCTAATKFRIWMKVVGLCE